MSGVAKGTKSKAERIRDWLTANPDGGRSGEIAKALKLTTIEVSMSLADLHRREDVVRCEVEVPGKRAEFHYRLSAKAGSPRPGQPWRTMSATSGPRPPRPERTTRPRGEVTYPPKPASAPATVLPTAQAVAVVVQEPVVETQNSVPAAATVAATAHYPEEWGPSDARQLSCVCGDPDPAHGQDTGEGVVPREASGGEVVSAAPPPTDPVRQFEAHAQRTDPVRRFETYAQGFARASDTAIDAADALRDLERVLDPDAPPVRPREEAIAQAAAEASRDWVPEPTQEPPPPMLPRFGLFSDGTLILENLPNLPPIIAIRREHTRALVKYLLAVNE